MPAVNEALSMWRCLLMVLSAIFTEYELLAVLRNVANAALLSLAVIRDPVPGLECIVKG